MKKIILYSLALIAANAIISCKKVIDLYPESNLTTENFYKTPEEVQTALLGCYNSIQKPTNLEWQLTELRSDNAKMGVPASTNTTNRDLSDLDYFIPSTGHPTVYQYWLRSYNTIRNVNTVLQVLGVKYSNGAITLDQPQLTITDSLRKQYAGEAMILRANAYFNLVRLYGGVFLVDKPLSAAEAKTINRSSVADIYKFIEADLNNAANFTLKNRFTLIPAAMAGRVNAWTAKGLLAKVLLTQNKKTDAQTLLNDIILNSGYGLQSQYANIFAATNELNNEILFAVRYKSGNIGLGSSFGNDFAPLGSGNTIINGSGLGYNYPTLELDTLTGITTNIDPRKNTAFGITGSGASRVLYVKKFLNPVTVTNDGESDFPVLRYADILLMSAEAQGNTPASLGLINQVRVRAGLIAYLPTAITTTAQFEQALALERRLEFMFENQRFFDLVRFNSTLTTITAEQTIKDHYAKEFARHYGIYANVVPLAQMQANIIDKKLLLPIPQYEIDTNTQLQIAQNPGYQ